MSTTIKIEVTIKIRDEGDRVKLEDVVVSRDDDGNGADSPERRFFDECCEIVPDGEFPTTITGLHEIYLRWAEMAGIEPLGRGRFSKAMQRIDGAKIKRRSDAKWFNIRPRPPVTDTRPIPLRD